MWNILILISVEFWRVARGIYGFACEFVYSETRVLQHLHREWAITTTPTTAISNKRVVEGI